MMAAPSSSSVGQHSCLLPPCTVALMVHKLFQDRVVQHLLASSSASSSSSSFSSPSSRGSAGAYPIDDGTNLEDDDRDRIHDDGANETTAKTSSNNTKKRPRPCQDSNSSNGRSGSLSYYDETKEQPDVLRDKEGCQGTKNEESATTPNKQGSVDDQSNSASPSLLWQPYGHHTKKENMRVLHTQRLTGVSQARRGYVLLLVTLPYNNNNNNPDDSLETARCQAYCYDVCRTRLEQLSPMARQNISFVCYMTHQFHCGVDHTVPTTSPSSSPVAPSSLCMIQELAQHTWKELTSNYGFELQSSLLRVEVQPRQQHPVDTLTHQFEVDVCCELERQAWRSSYMSSDDSVLLDYPITDPFTDQAPISWIKSKSKCTHQLTLIVLLLQPNPNNTDSSTSSSSYTFTDCYWGIECRRTNHHNQSSVTTTPPATTSTENDRHCNDSTTTSATNDVSPKISSWQHHSLMDVPLNHQAANEIVIVPCHPKTGEELTPHKRDTNNTATTSSTTTSVVPLSRAYYKLHQVWKEQLHPNLEQWNIRQGCGLDLGACPGGWTQVLVEMGMSHVVAVDPGAVGHRVASLPNVAHIRSSMEDACTSGTLQQYGPYSLVVCDASVMWMNVLQLLITTIAPNATFTLPSVWVITIKLPFKTLGSIQRHVSSLQDVLPLTVQELKRALYPTANVHAKHQLLHLMANSDSERTVLVVFEPKTQRKTTDVTTSSSSNNTP